MRLPELPAVNWNQVQPMIIPARQDSGWISGSAFPFDDPAGPNESGRRFFLIPRRSSTSTPIRASISLAVLGLSFVFLIVAGYLKAGR
jgi:hypothetical protein